MGAVIGMEGSKANRRQMFDLGIAGPLAGLAMALPIAWIGIPRLPRRAAARRQLCFHNPLFFQWLIAWIRPEYPTPDFLYLNQFNPFLMASWMGMLVTGLNMLPISQFDGGHVVYALLGLRPYARPSVAGGRDCVYHRRRKSTWVIMLVLVILLGVDHPPTADDTLPTGPGAKGDRLGGVVDSHPLLPAARHHADDTVGHQRPYCRPLAASWPRFYRYFPHLPPRCCTIPGQSGWWRGETSHYNPPDCLTVPSAGSTMVGHGRPRASQGRLCRPRGLRPPSGVCRCALAVLLALLSHAAWADDLRVRIAWGGGPERVWQGTIAVSDGSLSEPRPLGIEADEPGSMWLDGDPGGSQKLVIQQRSPRSYDGVDCWSPPPTAQSCSCNSRPPTMSDADRAHRSAAGRSLRRVCQQGNSTTDGNRLLVMRTPGDSLRVSLARDSLVFAPGETFHARSSRTPCLCPKAAGRGSRFNFSAAGRSFGRSSTTCRPARR